MMSDTWGADVPISMPVPPETKPLVDMGGGFSFGVNGMCHAITEEEWQENSLPTFAPPPLEL